MSYALTPIPTKYPEPTQAPTKLPQQTLASSQIYPTAVGDIWLGIGSVGTDHGPGAGAAAGGRKIDPGATPVGYIWLDANVCWGSLVGACVGSGYLVGIGVS